MTGPGKKFIGLRFPCHLGRQHHSRRNRQDADSGVDRSLVSQPRRSRRLFLSRGYGHEGGINDEGMVLEENLPVPHLQDPDRAALAEIAVTELETELIILDDGFQHRRLARDVDLVMLDALTPSVWAGFSPGVCCTSRFPPFAALRRLSWGSRSARSGRA